MSTSHAIEDPARHNLLVRVARLYYHYGLTHRQIAEREGLNRVKVTRLLQEAVEHRIVEFVIRDPVVETLELEEELAARFGLRRALVAPTVAADALFDTLGRFGADLLVRSLTHGTTVGMGWGRTLNAMPPYLSRAEHEGIRVVSLVGGLAANPSQPNPYDVASATARALGATVHYPLAPAICENVETRRALLGESRVLEVCRLWEQLDIAVLSIGVPTTQTGFHYSFADPESELAKARARGAVGDVLGRPFDAGGAFVEVDYLDRILGIDLDLLKRVPTVVGIAGGDHKVIAIRGALKTGLLDELVTDETTAAVLLGRESSGG